MNPDLNKLQPYPFEKLLKLKKGIEPSQSLSPIALSVGEPKHSPPEFVLRKLIDELPKVSQYPATKGLSELRLSISNWLNKRFSLKPDTLTAEKHILPVNGTREALFAFAQAIIDRTQNPLVIMPNPFYQIYEGAAYLAGAEPLYLNGDESNHYLPDFSHISDEQWKRCQLVYVCSPNNPTGSVLSIEDYKQLIELADKHDFVIASDECYSEIYPDDSNPPAGLLETCATIGRDDYHRCIVFHSLSKRSNLPGLRSGFVAGDAEVLKQFLSYRTYHGCAMSVPTQLASIAAWDDEDHVVSNREMYRQKFALVSDMLSDTWRVNQPMAGFNFWAKTPIDDEKFTQLLFEKTNITVLPGSYLSREVNGNNPGKNHVRMAMVAPIEECIEASHRIQSFLTNL
ncbi:MAG: succinyldiaminopimelate transaminase [Cellvibrionaceae bacterium]